MNKTFFDIGRGFKTSQAILEPDKSCHATAQAQRQAIYFMAFQKQTSSLVLAFLDWNSDDYG